MSGWKDIVPAGQRMALEVSAVLLPQGCDTVSDARPSDRAAAGRAILRRLGRVFARGPEGTPGTLFLTQDWVGFLPTDADGEPAGAEPIARALADLDSFWSFTRDGHDCVALATEQVQRAFATRQAAVVITALEERTGRAGGVDGPPVASCWRTSSGSPTSTSRASATSAPSCAPRATRTSTCWPRTSVPTSPA